MLQFFGSIGVLTRLQKRVAVAADRPTRRRSSAHAKYNVSHQTICATRPSCWIQISTVGVINSWGTTIRSLWHSPVI